MTRSLRYSVGIPTMNRPEELRRCLRHVLAQRPMPERILVADDGALAPDEVRGWLGANAGKLVYHRKTRPGLPESISVLADLCESPWLLLLDDDIYLARDFMARMLDALAEDLDAGRLAAIAGYPVSPSRARRRAERRSARARGRRLLERFFLLGGGVEARYLPSSYCTDFEQGCHPNAPYAVEHVPGGLGLWRTTALRAFRCDPWYSGYAAGVDKEMAYRASRRYRLVCQPAARALHARSPRARTNRRAFGKMRVQNQRYFFRRHFARKPWARLCFGWALFGAVVLQALSLVSISEFAPRLMELVGMAQGAFAPLRAGGRAQ